MSTPPVQILPLLVASATPPGGSEQLNRIEGKVEHIEERVGQMDERLGKMDDRLRRVEFQVAFACGGIAILIFLLTVLPRWISS